MTKVSKADQEKARETLRTMFPAGSEVPVILRHVSQSGMQRAISVIDPKDLEDVSYIVARALGWSLHPRQRGVRVNGAGMNMAFHLVYTLSSVLHGDGYALRYRLV